MICSSCGSKRSYCVESREYCKVCHTESTEKPLTYVATPSNAHVIEAGLYGWNWRAMQGYKGYGIIQKY